MLPDYFYIVNVEGAVVKDGRYLLVTRGAGENHAAGLLSLIGGKIENTREARNVLEETLRREIEEEVGVQVGAMAYVESKSFIIDTGEPVVDIVFLCQYAGGEVTVKDAEEVAALHWLTAPEVLRFPGAPPWTQQSILLAEQKRLALGW
ncbi:MAG: NUDIX domain-containing protein [Chloroflexi bacterium]|nr:NUDIX domain-containing protein [Chloroflexota bacterium]